MVTVLVFVRPLLTLIIAALPVHEAAVVQEVGVAAAAVLNGARKVGDGSRVVARAVERDALYYGEGEGRGSERR